MKITIHFTNNEGCTHCKDARWGIMTAAAIAKKEVPGLKIRFYMDPEAPDAPKVEFFAGDKKIVGIDGLPNSENYDLSGIAILREYLRGIYDTCIHGLMIEPAKLEGLFEVIRGFDEFVIESLAMEGIWNGS